MSASSRVRSCERRLHTLAMLQWNKQGADKEELSTYAAAFQAGCAFGALVAPVLVDKLGRKPTLVFGAMVTTLLNYGSAFATSFNMLLGIALSYHAW